MKAKTFPWLLMQNNTFQPNKEMKDLFSFYLNAHKAKRENINKSKTKKKLLA
jgi:hypothetical protein